MIPEYWKDFLNKNNFQKSEIEIPASADLSELNDEEFGLYILDEKMIMEEATDYYPGIAVKPHGYIPVAGCQHGSGDPYFINTNDGIGGKLYRIYHDEVIDKNYDKEKAIDVVLNNYEDLLKYKIT